MKCVGISKKYGLRPPIITPKNSESKHTRILFKKEIDGTWASGVLMWIVKDGHKYRMSIGGGIDFRGFQYETSENVVMIKSLSRKLLIELNANLLWDTDLNGWS